MSSSLSPEVSWAQDNMAKPGQAVAARAKRGKRGVLLEEKEKRRRKRLFKTNLSRSLSLWLSPSNNSTHRVSKSHTVL
jgi:hypothetical protein